MNFENIFLLGIFIIFKKKIIMIYLFILYKIKFVSNELL